MGAQAHSSAVSASTPTRMAVPSGNRLALRLAARTGELLPKGRLSIGRYPDPWAWPRRLPKRLPLGIVRLRILSRHVLELVPPGLILEGHRLAVRHGRPVAGTA